MSFLNEKFEVKKYRFDKAVQSKNRGVDQLNYFERTKILFTSEEN